MDFPFAIFEHLLRAFLIAEGIDPDEAVVSASGSSDDDPLLESRTYHLPFICRSPSAPPGHCAFDGALFSDGPGRVRMEAWGLKAAVSTQYDKWPDRPVDWNFSSSAFISTLAALTRIALDEFE